MKNTKTTIKAKIAFLEALQETIDSVEQQLEWCMENDENGNTKISEYYTEKAAALQKIIAILEKEI